jgi:putative addiction module component (TIGR02574 family)
MDVPVSDSILDDGVRRYSGCAGRKEALMGASLKSLGIDLLSTEQRLALVEELWDSIAADGETIPITEPQRAELDRRLAELDLEPDAGTPWDEVRAALAARLRT